MVAVRMALRGLGANKLRSFLTVLGVIIGVGAVIIAVAIGEGSKAAVSESLRRMGTNVLSVMPGQRRTGGVNLGFGSMNTLTMADANAILRECSSIQRISPSVSRSMQVKATNKNTNTTIYGQGADYPVINNHVIRGGRFFTSNEVKNMQRVAILGSTTAKDLFDQQSPINKTVRVNGISFKVIGVFQEKGGMGFRNPDDGVYVPVTTAMRRLFGVDYVQNITCQARAEALMMQGEDEVKAVLRKRHKIDTSGSYGGGDSTGGRSTTDDFMIFNQADLAEAQNEQQSTFSSLIQYLAVVSLLVGGIGIMNIMLVSVTERTREIGIRKAIGAKRRDVLIQFLLEAVFLSLVGGLFGVSFGVAGSLAVGYFNNWTIVILPSTLILAFSFSAAVGVFFGLYPALKASKLNPIEALRYE